VIREAFATDLLEAIIWQANLQGAQLQEGVFCISPRRGIFLQDTLLTTTKASG
jgi:hypothetical protein